MAAKLILIPNCSFCSATENLLFAFPTIFEALLVIFDEDGSTENFQKNVCKMYKCIYFPMLKLPGREQGQLLKKEVDETGRGKEILKIIFILSIKS